MKIIDLHTHTNCSDGTLSPTELIQYAKVKNLSAIAITDHDTIEGLEEGAKEAAKHGIEFINGIEFGTTVNRKEFHILGLMFDRYSQIFKNFSINIQEEREERNIKISKLLQAEGVNIEYSELLSLVMSKKNVITRGHFAKLLVAKGYAKNIDYAFFKYLSEGSKAYVPRNKFDAKRIIEIIHDSGGIAILAHPNRYGLDLNKMEEVIVNFKNLGIDGIEAIYSSHNEQTEKFFKSIAVKYNLKISGGTDFHGANKPNIDLGYGFGNLQIPIKILEDLKAK